MYHAHSFHTVFSQRTRGLDFKEEFHAYEAPCKQYDACWLQVAAAGVLGMVWSIFISFKGHS
jgi:glycerol-3-phosphate acyltransferase PlsY